MGPIKRLTGSGAPAARSGSRRLGRSAGASGPTPPLDGLLAGLRLALGTGDPPADAAALSRVADWGAVTDLVAYHRVAPLFLKGLGEVDDVRPAGGIEARLRRLRDRALVRGLGQIDALKQAAGALAANGIPCIVLKGLPLSSQLHGQPLAREAIDVDLLVAPDTFPRAERVLGEHGWRRIFPDFRETPLRKRWYEALVKDAVLAGPHRGGGPRPVIELHHRLLDNPFLLDAPFKRLYAHGCTVEIDGHPFRTLGDDDQLPYLACHGLWHYWHRLKWLCDIAVLVRSIDDDRLARLVARCREDGLEYALAPAFALCEEALHTGIPRAAASLPHGRRRAALVARFACRAWDGREPSALQGLARDIEIKVARLFRKSGVRYGLFELARFMIAPHDFGRLNLPDRLFFLYPLLRPVIWLVIIVQRLRGRR